MGDWLNWLGGVVSGLAVIGAAWAALTRVRLSSDVLLGKWYGYSYFYDSDGVKFYKEIVHVHRSRFYPWRVNHSTEPCGAGNTLGYQGPVYYHAPYVYTSAYERSSGDRTFDIGRLVMDGEHQYKMIVSLHLGDSYEETVHSASAYLWVRDQLDQNANERLRPNKLEETEFRRQVARFIRVDKDYLQIQLTPPRKLSASAPHATG